VRAGIESGTATATSPSVRAVGAAWTAAIGPSRARALPPAIDRLFQGRAPAAAAWVASAVKPPVAAGIAEVLVKAEAVGTRWDPAAARPAEK
jgi:hypothetical protein